MVTASWIEVLILTSLCTLVLSRKPNILLMMADDLGIGDIGCFGNTTLRTPHIDSIASNGIKLSQHLSAACVCTPSRAALLTGRYPVRSGMAANHNARMSIFTASSTGLPTSEITFAKLAKAAGYSTGLIGKWHLGLNKHRQGDFEHHPKKHGFDYYYGVIHTILKDFGDDGEHVLLELNPTIPHRLLTVVFVMAITLTSLYRKQYINLCTCVTLLLPVMAFVATAIFVLFNLKTLNGVVYRDYDLVEQPVHVGTQMRKEVEEGREFLERREADQAPFLLFISWVHPHTYLAPPPQFLGKSQHGKYGDSVEELDWAVGEILRSLKELGMVDNTLVYFTSDHGGHLEERNIHGDMEGGFNGIYKGGKGHGAVDGGIRVPAVVQWPGQIPRGSVSHEPTSTMDVFPTLAGVMGVPLLTERQLDGRDILPLLLGGTSKSPHDFLFHYCGDDIHAVRFRPRDGEVMWKLVLKEPNYLPGTQTCQFLCDCNNAIVLDPPYLYDMTSDPSE